MISIHKELNRSSRVNLQGRNHENEQLESRKRLRESTGEQRGSRREQCASMREHRGSIYTTQALASEQSGEA